MRRSLSWFLPHRLHIVQLSPYPPLPPHSASKSPILIQTVFARSQCTLSQGFSFQHSTLQSTALSKLPLAVVISGSSPSRGTPSLLCDRISATHTCYFKFHQTAPLLSKWAFSLLIHVANFSGRRLSL